jgi:probable HAF family extracellular repeat protein
VVLAIHKSSWWREHAGWCARLVVAIMRGRNRRGRLATTVLLTGVLTMSFGGTWSLGVLAVPASAAPTRSMTDLGTLRGATNSQGTPINALGQITGSNSYAFAWTASRGMQDLGTLGGTNSFGNAINDLGQVTGSADTSEGVGHAFRWTASGGMHDLLTLPGGKSSGASAINDLGQVTGSADTSEGVGHAFRWTASGGMQDLGALLGGANSYASAINDLGAGRGEC